MVDYHKTISSVPIGTLLLFSFNDGREFEIIRIDETNYVYNYLPDMEYIDAPIMNSTHQFNLLDTIGKALEFDEDMEKLLS